jgi:uncharacterized membrane protein YgcG
MNPLHPRGNSRAPGRLVRLALAACLLLAGRTATAVPSSLPRISGYVDDLAGVLDSGAQTALDTELRDLDRRTGTRITLVTVSSLDGRAVEAYASGLFAEAPAGTATAEHRVLVLVAPADQRMWIEVDHPLEPVFPLSLRRLVMREDFLPAFGRGDYRTGILTGMRRVTAIVRRHHVLTARERADLAGRGDLQPPAWMVACFALLIAGGALAAGVGVRTKTIVPLMWGGVFGLLPLALAFEPLFGLALRLLLPTAIAALGVGWMLGGRERWRRALRPDAPGGTARAGWVMGGGSHPGR